MPIPHITLQEGDITDVAADAIVNAANSSLLGAVAHRDGAGFMKDVHR